MEDWKKSLQDPYAKLQPDEEQLEMFKEEIVTREDIKRLDEEFTAMTRCLSIGNSWDFLNMSSEEAKNTLVAIAGLEKCNSLRLRRWLVSRINKSNKTLVVPIDIGTVE